MKIIELRRHSKKSAPGNSNLSPAGIELAERVGATELQGKRFTHLFISPLQRTKDTLIAMQRGATDFPAVEPQNFAPHAVAESGMSLWEGACNRAEHAGQYMLAAALNDDPDTARAIAHKGAEAFKVWLNELPHDAHALVIHHSPFLELIAYSLFGVQLPQLQPCEGFTIIEELDKLRLK